MGKTENKPSCDLDRYIEDRKARDPEFAKEFDEGWEAFRRDCETGKCEAIFRSCPRSAKREKSPPRTRGDIQGGAARPLLFDSYSAKRVAQKYHVAPGHVREPHMPENRNAVWLRLQVAPRGAASKPEGKLTVEDSERIMRKYGGRPCTADEQQIFSRFLKLGEGK
jgi:hypothetical protein